MHPRFGPIKYPGAVSMCHDANSTCRGVRSVKKIHAGEEVFVTYDYELGDALNARLDRIRARLNVCTL